MTTITLTCSTQTIEAMRKFYQPHLTSTPNYAVFAARYHQTHITAYRSGKVVFQGSHPAEEAKRWGEVQSPDSPLPFHFSEWNIIGSDETGNGSYFGPVTICATYVNQSQIPILKQLGVKDSKQLSDEKMQAIAPQLKEILPYKLLVVTPEKYNQVQPHYNAVHMKVVLHNRALALLEQQLTDQPVDGILIDQFTCPKNYQRYIQNESPQPRAKTYFATKGEQYHLAVAAASIIARVAFLDELRKEGQALGYDTLPSGAGQKVNRIAVDIVTRYGEQALTKVAKLHFANTKKVMAEIKKNRSRG